MFEYKGEDGSMLAIELNTANGKHQWTVRTPDGREAHAQFHPDVSRGAAKKVGEALAAENERLAKNIESVMASVAAVEAKAAESVGLVNDAMQERAAALAALELQKSKTEQAEAKIAELEAHVHEQGDIIEEQQNDLIAHAKAEGELEGKLKELQAKFDGGAARVALANPFDAAIPAQ